MNHTGNRYQIDDNTIVIFGAGKIGRSFIGQLFGVAGYKIIFIDIDPLIVARLNSQRYYRIIVKGAEDQEITINNVQAISFFEGEKVREAVSAARILAVSVGKNAIEKVIPLIASGLELRYIQNPDCPLDIIIAENMREAGDFIKEKLTQYLSVDYPIGKLVGLVESSIGKMVPIMTSADLEKDPLMVYAEAYNTLILDGNGFRSTIPDIKGLAPKTNIKAWVDRKAFIHNLGHATAAYYGFYHHPDAVYMYEILDDSEVFQFTRNVMLQSAGILQTAYPFDFTFPELEDHIDDLIVRFRNKALRDTIFRVGHDLTRKLKSDDRFVGAINLAVKFGLSWDKILKAMSYGLCFRVIDDEKHFFPADIVFLDELERRFEDTLVRTLEINPETDYFIIKELKKHYKKLTKK